MTCAPLDAFIQAGGRSVRMGRDKALLPIAGRALLERVADAAAAVAGRVVLVTNDPRPYARFGLESIPDRHPGMAALGGIATALAAAATPRVLVLACDLPFVSPGFLHFLAELDPAAEATVPETAAQGLHALCAVYATSCLVRIELQLAAGRLKASGFLGEVRLRRVSEAEMVKAGFAPAIELANVNTPEEYEQALVLAGRS